MGLLLSQNQRSVMSIDLDKRIKVACVSSVLAENLNRKLIGEILTIVDASIADLESRKAAKSLIRNSFSRVNVRILEDLSKLEEI